MSFTIVLQALQAFKLRGRKRKETLRQSLGVLLSQGDGAGSGEAKKGPFHRAENQREEMCPERALQGPSQGVQSVTNNYVHVRTLPKSRQSPPGRARGDSAECFQNGKSPD